MRKCVMVVAHPDDETLWAGGLVLTHPGDWTIISCQVPKLDPIRSQSFLLACRTLGAKGVNRPQALDPDFHLKLGDMDLSDYDHIVTHGAKGEYGHEDHINLHKFIMKNWKHKPITTFGYDEGKYILRLDALTTNKKLEALKKYDYIRSMYESEEKLPMWKSLVNRNYKGRIRMDIETYDGAWPV